MRKLNHFFTFTVIFVASAHPSFAISEQQADLLRSMKQNFVKTANAMEACTEKYKPVLSDYFSGFGQPPEAEQKVVQSDISINKTASGDCNIKFDVVIEQTAETGVSFSMEKGTNVKTEVVRTFTKGDCTYDQEYIQQLRDTAASIDIQTYQKDVEAGKRKLAQAVMPLMQMNFQKCADYKSGQLD